MASKFGAEIHRRLADHQPVDYVAQRTGLKPRAIRWHRSGHCQCQIDGLEVDPVTLDRPVRTSPVVLSLEEVQALPWHGQIRYGYIAGLTEQDISVATGMNAGFIAAVIGDDVRAEAKRRYEWAVGRVQEMFPVKWLKHQEEARQRELLEAAQTSIDPELTAAFFTQIIGHQRSLLIVSEFPDFLEWLRELTVFRYPELAEVLEAAIEAEARALENLVD